ncbi:arginase family protein [Sphingomonas arenae]|uniref:arginase family protein n=1 Tax=Sphingomonas arenae TaxID=2812555 RepID=UPI00196780CC|nr:arginase family protein [Sphingomonas arenae]
MTSAWPNLSDLLTGADSGAPVGLVGAPLALGSVTPGRCDLAPATLRGVLRRIGTYDIETRRELSSLIADRGDIAICGDTIEQNTARIRDFVSLSVSQHALTLLIGGNNAVTRPGVHGLGLPLDKVGLITLDAHLDMRDTSAGLGNGNPVRALIEDGLPGRNIAQIGLAPFANSRAMHEDALAAGNRVITIQEVRKSGILACVESALAGLSHCEALLVDCDIDVIDRSQFPAAPGARPGGMSATDFFAATRHIAAEPRVRVIDLTEWDPPLDATDLSALTAGRWLAEVLAGFEAR